MLLPKVCGLPTWVYCSIVPKGPTSLGNLSAEAIPAPCFLSRSPAPASLGHPSCQAVLRGREYPQVALKSKDTNAFRIFPEHPSSLSTPYLLLLFLASPCLNKTCEGLWAKAFQSYWDMCSKQSLVFQCKEGTGLRSNNRCKWFMCIWRKGEWQYIQLHWNTCCHTYCYIYI